MSSPVTRSTGAAREWEQRSLTRAATSPPTPPKPAASETTTQRPVLRTDAATVSSSNGTIVRRSTTSTSQPSSSAATSAALSALGTWGPYATSVTSLPSRLTAALPNGSVVTGSSSSAFDQ